MMLKNGLTHLYDKDDKRPLPIGKNNKVIGLFKDDLRGKIMKEFSGPKAKTHVYLIGGDSERKKAKGTKKCLIKRILKFMSKQ